MKVKTITFSQSNESINSIGLHKWNKFDVVAELDENDNEDVCALNLAAKVEMWHQELNPQINWNEAESYKIPTHGIELVQLKDERIQSFIATINMCDRLPFLKNFEARVVAENNSELSAAYTNKLTELNK